ncbi:MAG: hypothetical protein OEU92_29555 [Alphaproteobacteria bacterium]|nr:hypothetical protein [Alphaproteobacteria bacterium]
MRSRDCIFQWAAMAVGLGLAQTCASIAASNTKAAMAEDFADGQTTLD